MEKTVAVFQKNAREQVRVLIREFKGKLLVDLRVFWSTDGETWLPSKRGLAVGLDKLPLLVTALSETLRHLNTDVRLQEPESSELLDPEEKKLLSAAFDISLEDLDKEIIGA